MWQVSVITAPTVEPLDLDSEVAPFLRLASDEAVAQATILAGMISGARTACETFTERALISRVLELWMSEWWEPGIYREDRLRLPWPPLTGTTPAVTSVKYLDPSGIEQTWSSTTGWEAVIAAGEHAGRVEVFPRYGQSYPANRCQPASIKIRYPAGYGTTFASIPARLKQGMLLYIGEAYARRELATAGTILPANPISAERCWWPFKAF